MEFSTTLLLSSCTCQ